MKLIETKNAVGHVLCHDMTQIIVGVTKDARFRKGHVIKEEDIPVLLSMGKEHLYVWEDAEGMLHENDAALRLFGICKGSGIRGSSVKEGKVDIFAECSGVFIVDVRRLSMINSIDQIVIATRHSGTVVKAGEKLAGTRVVPLMIDEKSIENVERVAGDIPLMNVYPFKVKTAAVIATGSEIKKGIIEDSFTPVMEQKLAEFGVEVKYRYTPGDDKEAISAAIHSAHIAGAELILCTGGMSVDPDDRTPAAIKQSGVRVVKYGAPVLPGAMFLLGYFDDMTSVIGLPGCAMYVRASVFDIMLPKLLAKIEITKDDIAELGHGGLCLQCAECSFPVCPYGK